MTNDEAATIAARWWPRFAVAPATNYLRRNASGHYLG